jgi:hypothetical protein
MFKDGLAASSTVLKIVAAGYTESSVTCIHIQCHIPEAYDLHKHCAENLVCFVCLICLCMWSLCVPVLVLTL